jgi:hypothetical protein
MSGNAFPHERNLRRLLEKRLVDFLPKPFTPMQLLELIGRCLKL